MTKKRLTPVLIPAVGFTVGKYFIKCSVKTQKWAFDNSLLLFSNLNRLVTLFTLADF